MGNLNASFDTVVRGTFRKSLREGKWLMEHRQTFLEGVRAELLAGRLEIEAPRRKEIHEGGKIRPIDVYTMATRIKVNAVMSVADKYMRPRFIRTTGASIKGRGIHDLKGQIERDLRGGNGIRYWYKFDIRKFYETVKQDEVMACLRRVFKDKAFLGIMEQLVRLLPNGTGMSMGLRASQGDCNLLLSYALDHYIKDELGVRYYYRYCDDGVIGAADKTDLWCLRDEVHARIGGIGQQVKGNERVFPVDEGLDFLGYVIYPTHTELRKRVKQQFARRLARLKSRKRRTEMVGSLWGMSKHAACWHLCEAVLYPSEKSKLAKKRMKQFSQLGIKYVPADGKKRFPGKATALRQLVNKSIEVLDYERDVRTANGTRWLVQYRDTGSGDTGKFFTDCEEMKQALQQADEMGEMPFQATIAVEFFGDNKSKFRFT